MVDLQEFDANLVTLAQAPPQRAIHLTPPVIDYCQWKSMQCKHPAIHIVNELAGAEAFQRFIYLSFGESIHYHQYMLKFLLLTLTL